MKKKKKKKFLVFNNSPAGGAVSDVYGLVLHNGAFLRLGTTLKEKETRKQISTLVS